MKRDIVQHLRKLQKTFLQYFPSKMLDYDWIQNPFCSSSVPFTKKIMEEFIKFSSNGNLNLQFRNQLPGTFWLNVQNAYSTVAREALKKLLPFANTYLCEAGFLL